MKNILTVFIAVLLVGCGAKTGLLVPESPYQLRDVVNVDFADTLDAFDENINSTDVSSLADRPDNNSIAVLPDVGNGGYCICTCAHHR